jgi:predicted Zn-dependent protease
VPDEIDLVGVSERVLSKAMAEAGVSEAEAYASTNVMTMARIETLARPGVSGRPSVQQLKRLEDVGAAVKVVIDGAVGSSSTRDLTEGSLAKLVESAVGSASIMSADPNFVSLPKPLARSGPSLLVDRGILEGSADEALADAADAAISALGGEGLELAGSIIAVGSKVAVANSHGIALANEVDTFTVAQFTVEQMEGPKAISSGMGWSTGRRLSDLDAADAALQGAELARLRPERSSVPEGDYNVILGEHSVADVLDNLMGYSMDLGAIYMGMSWLPTETKELRSGKEAPVPLLGEEVAATGFSLYDDPTLENGILSHSHDDEGLPTRKVDIIKDGVYEDVIGTSYWSYLYDREPTGSGIRRYTDPGRCASVPADAFGTNLVVPPGDMTLEEMVEASEGPTIYIPRTWYTYSTRYGSPGFSSSNRATSFVVENGELVPVAPNAFKLTGDITEIFRTIYGIGKEVKTATTWLVMHAPIVPMLASRGIRVSKPAGEG